MPELSDIASIKRFLKRGLLPKGCYVMAEHFGQMETDYDPNNVALLRFRAEAAELLGIEVAKVKNK